MRMLNNEQQKQILETACEKMNYTYPVCFVTYKAGFVFWAQKMMGIKRLNHVMVNYTESNIDVCFYIDGYDKASMYFTGGWGFSNNKFRGNICQKTFTEISNMLYHIQHEIDTILSTGGCGSVDKIIRNER